MNLTLREVELCLMGAYDTDQDQDITLNRVTTDSRVVSEDDLFICIEGETFDGHNFATQAEKSGAAAIISSRMLPDVEDSKVIMVRDTLKAMGELARFQRDKTGAKVIGISGSAGKTTVKEMLATVLEQELTVSRSMGNFNNQVGLPLSIFAADTGHQAWVLELGISLTSDMDELGPIASPDMVLLTNVGPAHLQGLGTIEGVARAKASLLNHLRSDGTALVNMDYPELWEEARRIHPATMGFSTKDDSADFFCRFVGMTSEGQGEYELRTPAYQVRLVLDACGDHFAENIAAVIAAAHGMGISREAVTRGLTEPVRTKQRFQRKDLGKTTLIDDSYNANPLSMASSIRSARAMAGDRPLVLVLGDMLELGDGAAQAHEDLGKIIGEIAPDQVFYKGGHATDVARGMDTGMENGVFRETTTPGAFTAAWRELGFEAPVVLVKGSRSCRMEEYASALINEHEKNPGDERE